VSTRPIDLRNQPFGKWRVIHQGQKTPHGQFWVCYCVCNPAVTVELVEAALVDGWTRSCGCDYVNTSKRFAPRTDLVGRQRGKRLVLRYVPTTGGQRPAYHCRCVCGKEHLVQYARLTAQCRSCAQRKPLAVRWYGQIFVEAVVESDTAGKLLYQTRFADGSPHLVSGTDIRRGKRKGVGKHPHYGTVSANIGQVLAWRRAGISGREISRRLGLRPNAVCDFFSAHPEYQSIASVPSGTVAAHIDQVIVWLHAGVSRPEISRRLGLSPNAVHMFLRWHPEYQALGASLPPGETLIGEAS
jgi:DNA-binding CsgD family transcriptional regulator